MTEFTPAAPVFDGEEFRERDEIDDCLEGMPFISWQDGNLVRVTTKGNIPIANFLPVPVEDILYDDGNEQVRFFRIKGLKRLDEGRLITLPPVTIKAADAASMNWITTNWGFEANIHCPSQTNKDSLRSIMFTVGEKSAVQKTIFTHTGWREINGKWCYLHGGGAVGCDNTEVRLDNKLSQYNLSGEKKNFISVSDAVCDFFRIAKPKVMYPVIASIFLSPLNEFFRQAGCESSFVLYYLGRTQSRKSTLAALSLSFFGKFTSSSLPSSFKDTANAIEKKGYILKDVLTVVDDFHPATNFRERQNMEQIMQAISRGYGDRTGRDRMTSDITIRGGYAPRGNVIVTGEDFPSIGQSGTARNFIVELEPNDIPISDYLNRSQQFAAEGYFTAFMREYIKWLIPQTEQLPNKLKLKFLHYRNMSIEENFSGYGRTGDIISWLMIGFEFLTKFLCDSHILKESQAKEMDEKSWQVFTELAISQIEKSTEDTPTKMFIDTVNELFEAKKISVQMIGGFPNDTGEKVGYCDSNFYYFLPSKIYGEVVKFYAAQNETFPLTKIRLFRQLSSEGLIVSDKGVNTLQKRFGAIKGKYLCFPKAIFDGEKAA